jgi:thiamine biosynthesis lipoprotein
VWTVGIADPLRPGQILATVGGRDLAVATSGTAERGSHILDPFTGRPVTHLASATVVGPALATVDAYATAAFVLGRHALRWIDGIPGHAALLVDLDGRQHASAAWPG